MFYSIKSKLVLTVILLFASISIFIFLYFPARYEQMQLEALSSNAISINSLIAYSLSPALYFEDHMGMTEVITGAEQNKKIVYIIIHNDNHQVLAYNKSFASKAVYENLLQPLDHKNSVLKTQIPIMHNDKKIGFLYVGYDLAEIKNQIASTRLIIALISIILFLFGSIIQYVIIRHSFKPLTAMVTTTKNIALGDLSQRAIITNDEIGEVAKTFNEMMNDLEKSHNTLSIWNADLESRIKQRTIDLENEIEERKKTEIELTYAKEQAEEMNRLKSNFLSNMSHELRTPMIGILGYADIIQNVSEDAEICEMAEIIQISGNRLHNTLNQFLDLSKIESQQSSINLSRIEIVSLIEESVILYKQAALDKNIKLELEIKQAEIFINSHQNLFINLMNNLLNNAVKFTFHGTIKVTVLCVNQNVIIEVKDSGIGIPEDRLNTVFEPFRQASEGIGRTFEGTGLGLTLVKKYCDFMGGSISVESKLNEGSLFRITFPILDSSNLIPEDEKVESADINYYSIVKQNKILLVEDEDICIKAVRLYLKDRFAIEVCSNAEEALEIVNKTEFDLFLIDIGLKSKYNGIDIVKKIRQNSINRNKPVIAVTAYSMNGDKENFIKVGFTDYLSKPFYKKDILNIIENNLINSNPQLKSTAILNNHAHYFDSEKIS